MAREFISPTEIYDQADATLSESADHSVSVDHHHYAVIHGAIPRLTNSTIWRHRRLSHEWHRFLGLGPAPPQQPIRLAHHQIGHDFDVQSITDQVTKITTATLTSFFTNEVNAIIGDAVFKAVGNYFSTAQSPSSHLRHQLTPEINFPSSSHQHSSQPDGSRSKSQLTPELPPSSLQPPFSYADDGDDGNGKCSPPKTLMVIMVLSFSSACPYLPESPPHSQAGSFTSHSPIASPSFAPPVSSHPEGSIPVTTTDQKGKAREVIKTFSPEIIPTSDSIELLYQTRPSSLKCKSNPFRSCPDRPMIPFFISSDACG